MATTPSPCVPLELCEEIMGCLPVQYDPDLDIQVPYFTPSPMRTGVQSLASVRAISHFPYPRYMTQVIVDAGRYDCPLELIAELAPKLTATKTLCVTSSLDYTSPLEVRKELEHDRELQNAILPILHAPTLSSLLLQEILFTEEDLHKLITIPQNLATLGLENVRLFPKSDSDSSDSAQTTKDRRPISSLALHCFQYEDDSLIRWLLHPSCPIDLVGLKSLSLRIDDVGAIHDFLALLNAIGSSLKDFELFLPPPWENHYYASMIDAIPIIPNTHIEHITVGGFERRDPEIFHNSTPRPGRHSKHLEGAELVKCLLSRLSAPDRLQTVTIREDVEIIGGDTREDTLQWRNWQAVDEMLGQVSFSNVKRLNFVAGLNSLELQREDVWSWVTPQFSTFRERIGTVFDLIVDYTSLPWKKTARIDRCDAREYYVEKWGKNPEY
ncbi:hypothetical protein MSAN_00227400 [Mycena sanguinolenta]|uniref:Uncharacterized protein n=1 Tax=Mycena sanguinolenta TaxID=230812 RepID=A0A8H6ZM65_9AGAR|nr:hypothetical protein MSAN_00227400 [Mycena sanguinolenta]